MRPKVRKMTLLALRHHGPMTDAQLAWWLGHFGIKPGAAKKARWELTRHGLVRFARKAVGAGRGQLARLWEAAGRSGVRGADGR